MTRALRSAVLCAACLAGFSAPSPAATEGFFVLNPAAFAPHIERFNTMENENIVNLVPNAQSFDWLSANVPLFECSDRDVEEIYWYRWWSVRKHLKQTPTGFVFTEFLTKPNPISSALGHHIRELRWLRDGRYLDEYVLYWLRGHEGKPQPNLHKYSGWLPYALYDRYLATGEEKPLVALLDDLVNDYAAWERERRRDDGLFWQYDVWDAMEESISGSRTEKNVRPTINSYQYGSARALADIAGLAGKTDLAREYQAKAAALKRLTQATLWDPQAKFFKVRKESGALADVREAIGFIPWYFDLPDAGYEAAWAQLTDPRGFRAPYGLTTAERRHPQFRTHGCCGCEWDGAVWPYATSQTLTALANVLRHYSQPYVTRADYFDAFLTYVRSQHYDGLPYIGEYQDEITGQWLKGRQERSRYYHHSTFADLVITGVVGLCPRADDVVEVDPLLPGGKWDWFCLDAVPYHGRSLTILWDADGKRYGRGAGLKVLADGKLIAESPRLERVTGRLTAPSPAAGEGSL